MKVVLTPIGSSGDVFPSVGLACRLRQRGHDVVLITSSHFAALAAGVPQVVVPLSHDQPDHAARVVRLGAGERLFPRQLTATTLAAVLDRLLRSERVHARCAELAALTRADDGLDQACAHLERLAPAQESASRKSE